MGDIQLVVCEVSGIMPEPFYFTLKNMFTQCSLGPRSQQKQNLAQVL